MSQKWEEKKINKSMAVATAAYGSYVPSKCLHSALKIACQNARPPPLYISTKPSHVNHCHLQELCALCNHSCHRFPSVDSHGHVELVDIGKLRTALLHSSVVVSVFTRPEFISNFSSKTELNSRSMGIGGEWIQRVIMPVTPGNGRLVGFGRAVSDLGLTASIHDVMCIPGDPCSPRYGNRQKDSSKNCKRAYKHRGV